MGFKRKMTPESAVQTFIDCKKNQTEIPDEVSALLKDLSGWSENSLKGLLNASAYYPDILDSPNREKEILSKIEDFKKRIVPVKFY
jgi:hypothetical protein